MFNLSIIDVDIHSLTLYQYRMTLSGRHTTFFFGYVLRAYSLDFDFFMSCFVISSCIWEKFFIFIACRMGNGMRNFCRFSSPVVIYLLYSMTVVLNLGE